MSIGRSLAKAPVVFGFVVAIANGAAAQSYEASRDAAIQWLQTQQGEGGSWGDDPRRQALETQQVISALITSSERGGGYYRAVSWFENSGFEGIDSHARRIRALADRPSDLSVSLSAIDAATVEIDLETTGWGLGPGFQPSVLDSSLVLEALILQNLLVGVDAGVNYLLAEQSGDGGWAVQGEPVSDVVTTSIALTALVRASASSSVDVTAAISAASSFLQVSVGPADSPLKRAYASHALLAADALSPHGNSLLNSLVAIQDPVDGDSGDGAIAADVLTTAIAVQAMSVKLGTNEAELAEPVHVPDLELRRKVNFAIGRNAGDALRRGDLSRLDSLDLSSSAVRDISGLEYATELTFLDLRFNDVADLTPLLGLSALDAVMLYGNPGLGAPCDVSRDGDIDMADSVQALLMIQDAAVTLDDQAVLDVAPVSGPGDGVVDVADVLIVSRAAAGLSLATCSP